MSDAANRELQRQAATGDIEAWVKLGVERARRDPGYVVWAPSRTRFHVWLFRDGWGPVSPACDLKSRPSVLTLHVHRCPRPDPDRFRLCPKCDGYPDKGGLLRENQLKAKVRAQKLMAGDDDIPVDDWGEGDD